MFVAAIRRALLEGTVDLAVHSYKDLPTAAEPGLTIAAVPRREDPRDALVARDGLTLGELPPGSKVGTGAPAASPSCGPWASAWTSSRSGATSTPAWAGCAAWASRATSTPSSSPGPD